MITTDSIIILRSNGFSGAKLVGCVRIVNVALIDRRDAPKHGSRTWNKIPPTFRLLSDNEANKCTSLDSIRDNSDV